MSRSSTRRGLVAAIIMLALSARAIGHEGGANAGKAGPVPKEQLPWGIAGDAGAVTRTIEIRMSDSMRFTPDNIRLKQGEVVRFIVRNGGKLMHELVLGTKKELDEHAALMLKFPGMEHDEPYMAHVPAGQKADLIWNFNRPGEFGFACLVAGHHEAGMVGTIEVITPEPKLQPARRIK